MKRALLSVTDKTGLIELGRKLIQSGYELVSTGGTAEALRESGLDVMDVSSITGFPEMLDGRVKTLHPSIHGGLLGDPRRESHRDSMERAEIKPISLLCVNLYAFEKTVRAPHSLDEAIESIDIGGPAMLRAAAKNWANVTVLVDPADYAIDLGALDDSRRLKLAAKAFRHTAFYDSMVARYMTAASEESDLTETLTLGLRRSLSLRYGENPHQRGALFSDPLGEAGISQSVQLWGKELSYNNLLDADAAWELVADLPQGACALIKHGNPCGASASQTLAESYRNARLSDPISAFGGIAAFHGEVDDAAAEAMTEKGNFLEVIVANGYTEGAKRIFEDRAGWGQDVRLLRAPLPESGHRLGVRTIGGGALIQDLDEDSAQRWTQATQVTPTEDQLRSLKLAWTIAQHVKSNAIVVCKGDRMLGIGAGQMNRVQSVRLALEQAGDRSRGAGLASDAFFPFADSIETAARAGVAAIVQPGGSKKDAEVIASANNFGIAMMFTGQRHFRH